MSSQELLGQAEKKIKEWKVKPVIDIANSQLNIGDKPKKSRRKNQRLSWGWLSSLRLLKTVVKRYDASLIESVTESAVQVTFRWGSYIGLSYLIGIGDFAPKF